MASYFDKLTLPSLLTEHREIVEAPIGLDETNMAIGAMNDVGNTSWALMGP